MTKGKLVTKKTIMLVNGKETPVTVRMFRLSKRPKSVGMPLVMTPERWARFNERFKRDKPLRRPNRTRPMNGD